MSATNDKIEIENVNTPGKTERVERAKYEAMRVALLSVLTDEEPGSTIAEAKSALLSQLPEALYPEGKTAGWWLKAVQLDLESKGIIARAPTKPMRLYRITP
ncbi:DUF6958 family protein [Chelativorans xinjiangense]|uniref:DUF6958 family protein n=1 Tax=Chelativorans xinjiangense TaxID=2681485 RepID=UPI001357DFA1|nr:hypothetical protein [Chelativorans xinjiangense]